MASAGRHHRDTAALLLLVTLTVAAYRATLGYWWTGPDTFTLIATSRVGSLGDLWALLTQPLMAGTRFTDLAGFFRPTTSLSYAVDWALWGMDPSGYHLTNLLLHAGAVALTYLLAHRLLGRRLPALAAAGLFSLHPVVAESLPAISRRQDALATLLLLASLLAFLKARGIGPSHGPGPPARGSGTTGRLGPRAWQAFSLLLALLAYGAKEVALLLPILLAASLWLLDTRAPGAPRSRTRMAWVARRTAPHAAVWTGFLAWRWAVLGGLGGYVSRPALLSREVAWDLGQYVAVLVSPLRQLQTHYALSGVPMALLFLALGALLVLGTLLAYRGRVGALVTDLTRAAGTRLGRASAFCLVWLVAGGAVFLAARTFDDWSAYLFAVPYAILVMGLLDRSLVLLASHGAGRASPQGAARAACEGSRAASVPVTAAVALLLAGTVATSLVVSPGVRGEEDWAINAEVQAQVLPAFSRAVQAQPPGLEVVGAHNLTWFHNVCGGEVGRTSTVYHFQDFTLEDWLRLDTDGRYQVDVVIESHGSLDRWPSQAQVVLDRTNTTQADLELTYRPIQASSIEDP